MIHRKQLPSFLTVGEVKDSLETAGMKKEKFDKMVKICYKSIIQDRDLDKKQKAKALEELRQVVKNSADEFGKINKTMLNTINKRIKKYESSFFGKLGSMFGKVWNFTKKVAKAGFWVGVIGTASYIGARFGLFGKTGLAVADKAKEYLGDKFDWLRNAFLDPETAKKMKQQKALIKIIKAYKKIENIRKQKDFKPEYSNTLIEEQQKIINEQNKTLKDLGLAPVKSTSEAKKTLKGVHSTLDTKYREDAPGVWEDVKDTVAGWIANRTLAELTILGAIGYLAKNAAGKWYATKKMTKAIENGLKKGARNLPEILNDIKKKSYKQPKAPTGKTPPGEAPKRTTTRKGAKQKKKLGLIDRLLKKGGIKPGRRPTLKKPGCGKRFAIPRKMR